MNCKQILTIPTICSILLATSFMIISCSDSKQQNKTFNVENSSSMLIATDSVSLDTLDLPDVHKAELIDSMLVFEHGRLPYKLSAWNESSNKITHGVYKGQGPNEVMQYIPVMSYQKDAKYYADRANRKLYASTIEKDSFVIKEIKQFNDSTGRFFRLVDLNKDLYILMGIYTEGRFGVYNKNTNTLNYCSQFPENDKTQKLSPTHRAVLFVNSMIDINPNGERFVVTDHGLLDIYRITSNQMIESVESICHHFPIFKLHTDGVTTIAYEKNQPVGYIDIACTSQYIYLLYSEKTFQDCNELAFFSNTIHVYDWEGNRLSTYKTDHELSSISIHNATLLGLNKLNNRLYYYKLGSPDFYK